MADKKSKQPKELEEILAYGELRAQLDATMEKLQSPDCDVDTAVGLYEQALRYVTQLEQYLQNAENRVKRVQADFSGSSDSPEAGA